MGGGEEREKGTHEHGVARVAEEDDLVRGVDPARERLAVHEAPFQRRLDEAEKLPHSASFCIASASHVGRSERAHAERPEEGAREGEGVRKIEGGGRDLPRLVVGKVRAHLVRATLGGPRFDGAVVRVEEHEIELVL